MNELITALDEILTAETGTGKLLEGVTVLCNEHEGMKSPCVVLKRKGRETIQQNERYGAFIARADLVVLVQVSNRPGTSNVWRTAEEVADKKARLVEQVILRNPELVCTSYPSGITGYGEDTEIEKYEHVEGIVGNSTWYVGERLTLRVMVQFHDNMLTLK